jgi:hypothetical protein
MNVSQILRAAICIATLVLAAKAEAQAIAGHTQLTLNFNLQVTNLHPSVKMAEVRCKIAETAEMKGMTVQVPNHSYSGPLAIWFQIPDEYFNSHPDHTVTASCELWLHRYLIEPKKGAAIASATQPVPATESNWLVVGAGSTVKWSQVVTFPHAAMP